MSDAASFAVGGRRLPERPRLAIAGATGAVGQEFLHLLETRDFPLTSLKLLASARSKGKRVRFRGEELPVEELGEESFEDVDLAFFSCGGSRSLQFASAATRHGAIVIDNSSAFRMREDVPLIVPEVNGRELHEGPRSRSGIIANPNCSTILMVQVLEPLRRRFGLRRVLVSTYQAASGAGQQAMDSLLEDLRGWAQDPLGEQRSSASFFGHPLAFNVIPQIDVFLPDGSTKEERKMQEETQKILGLPDLPVDASCVRVPVQRSHAESLQVETEEAVDLRELRELFQASPGLEVVDESAASRYSVPSDQNHDQHERLPTDQPAKPSPF